jgi:hypothetical protein
MLILGQAIGKENKRSPYKIFIPLKILLHLDLKRNYGATKKQRIRENQGIVKRSLTPI